MVRRKRSQFLPIQPVILTRRMIRGIFVWSGSELWSLFKYSKLKLKNRKLIAVDVLFYAYLMVPLSWRSNLAGWYLCVFALRKGTSSPFSVSRNTWYFLWRAEAQSPCKCKASLAAAFILHQNYRLRRRNPKECNSVFVARHTALLYVNRQGKDTQLFLVHGIEVGWFSYSRLEHSTRR
jgi:hypothetical protein